MVEDGDTVTMEDGTGGPVWCRWGAGVGRACREGESLDRLSHPVHVSAGWKVGEERRCREGGQRHQKTWAGAGPGPAPPTCQGPGEGAQGG